MRPDRRSRYAVGGLGALALVLSLGWSADAVTGVRTDPHPRTTSAGRVIEASPDFVAFSPNGDGRLDRAAIGFTLSRAARVKVVVRDDGGPVRGPVRLGRLSEGRHVWEWRGRSDDGTVVPDGYYQVELRAVTRTRDQSAMVDVRVDTVRPEGDFVTTRPTVYPKASVVDDRVLLVWVLEGWNPWDEELFPEEGQLAVTRLRIRTPGGHLVWGSTLRDRYTPTFEWRGRTDRGRVLPEGRYVAKVLVADAAGNQRRAGQDLRVSHAQLEETVHTTTVSAAEAGRYSPYFGGCNGCGESASPVASERFADGLSFRADPDSWEWGAVGYFGMDVPFAPAPVDSFRVTAVGGPTTPGSSDVGKLDGTDVGPGDTSATTPWRAVRLTEHPFLPDLDRPVTWTFVTYPPNSYDVATFTVEYRHYQPVS